MATIAMMMVAVILAMILFRQSLCHIFKMMMISLQLRKTACHHSHNSIYFIWSRLYKYSSASNKGTMYQLRNLINRRNVRNKPDKDVNACEDFFLSFVRSPIIAAAISLFGMESHDSRPDENIFPPDHEDHDIADITTILLAAADLLVHQFFDISYRTSYKAAHLDHKQEYAKEVMTMGLFYLEFQDAIREGDGHRVSDQMEIIVFMVPITN